MRGINSTQDGPLIYKVYGWFDHGRASGQLMQVLSNGINLWFFDSEGKWVWHFSRSIGIAWDNDAYWFLDADSDAAGFKLENRQVDGKAEQIITTSELLLQSGSSLTDQRVPSVGPAAMRLYLDHLPRDNPALAIEHLVESKALFPADPPDLKIGPEELLVHTRDGCGLIIPYASHAGNRHILIDDYLRHSWLGECVNGLALGPGKLLIRSTVDNALVAIVSGWRLYGRPIGRSIETRLPSSSGNLPGSVTEGFDWGGASYTRSRTALGAPTPRNWLYDPPKVMVSSAKREVIYTLLQADQDHDHCKGAGDSCLEEQVLGGGDTHNIPCQGNCGAVWAEKVAPLLAEFAAAEKRDTPAVEAAKKSVEPLLKKLQAKRVQDARQRERQQAEAKAKREAEAATLRTQALTQANQSKRPVASPNVDALIKQLLKGGKS
ncbi:hypothetical protein [Fluviicoccus keumensis]|nr:hypothetical protein [Fluviicoccus keumensis]